MERQQVPKKLSTKLSNITNHVLKISESSIFFITLYLGFIAARIAKSALKFRERMRECLQSRTHDYEIEELEDDQRLVSRATSVFATRLDVLIVFSFSFLLHPPPRFFPSKSIHPLLAMLPS